MRDFAKTCLQKKKNQIKNTAVYCFQSTGMVNLAAVGFYQKLSWEHISKTKTSIEAQHAHGKNSNPPPILICSHFLCH